MAFIDLVKWNGNPDIAAWKFPSQELSNLTQLIVNESQEAFLVRGGVYEGPFGAGRHTLSTENLPLFRGLFGIPFGGETPFSAEVWFVNKVTNLSVLWGFPDPIQLQDPKWHVMLPVRAFGQYGYKISDSKKFLLKLVGTLSAFDSETLAGYFRGALTTRIKTEIANAIIKAETSVLEVATQLESLSLSLKSSLALDLDEYGVALTQFNIHSINVPESDPTVIKLKETLAKKAEMGILGFDYQQERSFDVLQTAAGNEGSAGGFMGAGIGIGAGLAVGGPLGAAFSKVGQQIEPAPKAATPASATSSAEDRIRILKELADLKNAGVISEEEFIAEKRRVLGQNS